MCILSIKTISLQEQEWSSHKTWTKLAWHCLHVIFNRPKSSKLKTSQPSLHSYVYTNYDRFNNAKVKDTLCMLHVQIWQQNLDNFQKRKQSLIHPCWFDLSWRRETLNCWVFQNMHKTIIIVEYDTMKRSLIKRANVYDNFMKGPKVITSKYVCQ